MSWEFKGPNLPNEIKHNKALLGGLLRDNDSKWAIDGYSSVLNDQQTSNWLGVELSPDNITIHWVVPPPSKSHHQDYYIFSRESL